MTEETSSPETQTKKMPPTQQSPLRPEAPSPRRRALVEACIPLLALGLAVLAFMLDAFDWYDGICPSCLSAYSLEGDPRIPKVAGGEELSLVWRRTYAMAATLTVFGGMGVVACCWLAMHRVYARWFEKRALRFLLLLGCVVPYLVAFAVVFLVDRPHAWLELSPFVYDELVCLSPGSVAVALFVLASSIGVIVVGAITLCFASAPLLAEQHAGATARSEFELRRQWLGYILVALSIFFVVGTWQIHVLNNWPADMVAHAFPKDAESPYLRAFELEASAAALRRGLLFSAMLGLGYFLAEVVLRRQLDRFIRECRAEEWEMHKAWYAESVVPFEAHGLAQKLAIAAAPAILAALQGFWDAL